MKDRDAVVPVVSLNVTVQVHVLLWVLVSLASTLGIKVMELSEPTVTLLLQLLSPLFQVSVPLAGPLHVNVTRLTSLKSLPVAESMAS